MEVVWNLEVPRIYPPVMHVEDVLRTNGGLSSADTGVQDTAVTKYTVLSRHLTGEAEIS
jgi:hypothetical protein